MNPYSISLFKIIQQKNHSISSDISTLSNKTLPPNNKYYAGGNNPLYSYPGCFNPFDFSSQKSVYFLKNNIVSIYLVQSISDSIKKYNEKKEEQKQEGNLNTGGNKIAKETAPYTAPKDSSQSSNTASIELEILHLINSARLNSGLSGLNFNSALNSVAAARSADMINRGYFSHTNPDGKNIFVILQEKGVGYTSAGENIFYAMPPSNVSGSGAFGTWMNSAPHRANILSGNFSQIGIGLSNNSGRAVITLVFTG